MLAVSVREENGDFYIAIGPASSSSSSSSSSYSISIVPATVRPWVHYFRYTDPVAYWRWLLKASQPCS